MTALNFTLEGVGGTVEIGKGGPRYKDDSGVVAFRNNADGAYVNVAGLPSTDDTHFVTQAQLNAVTVGIQWKESAFVATSVDTSITVTPATIDSESVSAGDRVLLYGQSTVTENGLWEIVAVGAAMIRPDDWLANTQQSGSAVMIREGTDADTGFVASADPAEVNVNDPLMLAFASTAAGVTSLIVDASATGETPISGGTGPTGNMTLKGFAADAGVTTVATVGDDIVYGIATGGVDTNELADDAVTEAKLGAQVIVVRRAAIAFGDSPGTVAMGAAVEAGVAVESRLIIDTPFDGGITVSIGHGGDPDEIFEIADGDPSRAGIYVKYLNQTLTAATIYNGTLVGTGTVGAGFVYFAWYLP